MKPMRIKDGKPPNGVRVLVWVPKFFGHYVQFARRHGRVWRNENWHRDIPIRLYDTWMPVPDMQAKKMPATKKPK